jgi:hypothetical protein
VTGPVEELPCVEPDHVSGLRRRYFFSAAVSDTFLGLDNVGLTVEWSEFNNVHFRQKNRPITNELGFSAQGSFGNSPAYYRNCVFKGFGSSSSAASPCLADGSRDAPSSTVAGKGTSR